MVRDEPWRGYHNALAKLVRAAPSPPVPPEAHPATPQHRRISPSRASHVVRVGIDDLLSDTPAMVMPSKEPEIDTTPHTPSPWDWARSVAKTSSATLDALTRDNAVLRSALALSEARREQSEARVRQQRIEEVCQLRIDALRSLKETMLYARYLKGLHTPSLLHWTDGLLRAKSYRKWRGYTALRQQRKAVVARMMGLESLLGPREARRAALLPHYYMWVAFVRSRLRKNLAEGRVREEQAREAIEAFMGQLRQAECEITEERERVQALSATRLALLAHGEERLRSAAQSSLLNHRYHTWLRCTVLKKMMKGKVNAVWGLARAARLRTAYNALHALRGHRVRTRHIVQQLAQLHMRTKTAALNTAFQRWLAYLRRSRSRRRAVELLAGGCVLLVRHRWYHKWQHWARRRAAGQRAFEHLTVLSKRHTLQRCFTVLLTRWARSQHAEVARVQHTTRALRCAWHRRSAQHGERAVVLSVLRHYYNTLLQRVRESRAEGRLRGEKTRAVGRVQQWGVLLAARETTAALLRRYYAKWGRVVKRDVCNSRRHAAARFIAYSTRVGVLREWWGRWWNATKKAALRAQHHTAAKEFTDRIASLEKATATLQDREKRQGEELLRMVERTQRLEGELHAARERATLLHDELTACKRELHDERVKREAAEQLAASEKGKVATQTTRLAEQHRETAKEEKEEVSISAGTTPQSTPSTEPLGLTVSTDLDGKRAGEERGEPEGGRGEDTQGKVAGRGMQVAVAGRAVTAERRVRWQELRRGRKGDVPPGPPSTSERTQHRLQQRDAACSPHKEDVLLSQHGLPHRDAACSPHKRYLSPEAPAHPRSVRFVDNYTGSNVEFCVSGHAKGEGSLSVSINGMVIPVERLTVTAVVGFPGCTLPRGITFPPHLVADILPTLKAMAQRVSVPHNLDPPTPFPAPTPSHRIPDKTYRSGRTPQPLPPVGLAHPHAHAHHSPSFQTWHVRSISPKRTSPSRLQWL
eukprot:Sspe_Gene.71822::Locus_42667_Transcript_1_1_Confidence_1.000_Length_3027::g.71822::m.71822